MLYTEPLFTWSYKWRVLFLPLFTRLTTWSFSIVVVKFLKDADFIELPFSIWTSRKLEYLTKALCWKINILKKSFDKGILLIPMERNHRQNSCLFVTESNLLSLGKPILSRRISLSSWRISFISQCISSLRRQIGLMSQWIGLQCLHFG